MIFSGQRIFLRPLVLSDHASLLHILSDPEVSAPIVFIKQPYDADQAMGWCVRAETGRQNATEWLMTIVMNENCGQEAENIIGHAGLHKDENAPAEKPEAEIGYWLGRAWWGQGLASEVASLLVDAGRYYGFKQLGATTAADNPASGRVLHKNGFGLIGSVHRKRPDGTMRQSNFYHRMI